MNAANFWYIMTSAQVSTALLLIAISLVVIAVKLLEKGSNKTSKRASR